MMGININDNLFAFTDWILDGSKTMETRNTPTLRPYLGQEVGIIKTGKGRAILVGYATIVKEVLMDVKAFRECEELHRVRKGSKYDIQDQKYGYILENVRRCEATPVYTKGIIARKVEV